ncbi:MAG TPA: SAM-dependent chlorinase/fluorinase [Alphaproteobacteria bacterium]|nr:SAM-dependent chlorinase/fluorinase [Alphaproteobacteria bacterium]
MIVLFTDFGPAGPYVGQVKAVLLRAAPAVPVIDLVADAPSHDPKASAYLLAALASEFEPRTVCLAVIDPGVGGERRAAIAEIDGRWYVGPDNGLFEPLLRRAGRARWWEITWRPQRLSSTFHGRDLFAPIAARLATGEHPAASTPGAAWAEARSIELLRRPDWPDELPAIIYIDHFGNAMTGTRAAALSEKTLIEVRGRRIRRARRFGDVPPGEAIWYENSSGLAEIAVNQGRADRALELAIGDAVAFR